ncbi:type II toxin-antitoxin system Phd/YefM family antitoxin [Pasteurellaceae bacterium USgator11]|nr:type II toxin-antitoxin system Phd/YefM family antitoxin [Pasteurellaceae bacterium USgator41]TNG95865.1 type II toxin-antitoxin system Phd/YefM family antitoxin [Pasteurellaceae bacterium UScroc12]TNG98967.1 type II toxin-antitoxin system Phd/YefM family antitoxin [Pasteurellaceae bacterium UScroc31]TNG99716.1 type II toxin-antitoxin system Phd/YefM family antitoxin [Pasteurellaceae bacterium USgator11]
MQTMTSREFNQRTHEAQKAAHKAPLLITNRGKPDLVVMSFSEYQNLSGKQPEPSFWESWLALSKDLPDVSEIELDIPPRSKAQRRPVEFD